MKVVCICGPHNSGKTTLMKRLIEELSQKGLWVSAAKSTKHRDLFLETGRDSSILVDAGSREVGVFEPKRTVLFLEGAVSPELIPFMFTCDVLLLEGFRHSPFPKIAIYKGDDEDYWRDVDNVVAAVAPPSVSVPWQVPRFLFEDVERIADFIRQEAPDFEGVLLEVNGRVVGMKPFVQRLLRDAVMGIVKNLKNTENARQVKIRIVL